MARRCGCESTNADLKIRILVACTGHTQLLHIPDGIVDRRYIRRIDVITGHTSHVRGIGVQFELEGVALTQPISRQIAVNIRTGNLKNLIVYAVIVGISPGSRYFRRINGSG